MRDRSLRRRALLILSVVPLGVLAACTGDLGDVASPGDDGGTGDDAAALCAAAAPDVGHAPLRRLTLAEYKNTVRVLLDVDTTVLPASFDGDGSTAGFVTNNNDYVTEHQLEAYMEAAEVYADEVVERGIDTLPGVDLDCEIDELSCMSQLVESFGFRAFRRPLTEPETARYVALFAEAQARWNSETAQSLVLRAFLQSPHFLYLPEIGASPVDGTPELVQLDDYELASRLSYFLWKTMPDDELFAAADAGDLASPEGMKVQALRMLDDERAAAAVESFHSQWLFISELDQLPKDPELYEAWSPEVAVELRDETLRVARRVILGEDGDGKLATLLTTRESELTPALEAYYDVSADEDGMYEFPAGDRAGILTHASVMASLAHSNHTSWTKRGHFVRENVLCEPLNLPAADVDMSVLNDPNRLVNPDCKGCHLLMDPIGAAFEMYDADGQVLAEIPELPEGPLTPFRIEEGTKEIDVAGEFGSPIELAEKLADSRTVADCVVSKWYTFATYRSQQDEDACAVVSLQERFADSGFDVRALIGDIAQSESFRLQRLPSEGQ